MSEALTERARAVNAPRPVPYLAILVEHVRCDRRDAQILQGGTLVIGRRVALRQVDEQWTGETRTMFEKMAARDERAQERRGRSAASQ